MIQSFDWRARGIQVGFIAILLIVWHYAGTEKLVNPIFLPRLDLVVLEFVRLFESGEVFGHLKVTLMEILVAYGVAASLGLAIGYAIGRSRYAVLVFEPLVAGIFAIPIIIFLPVFILFLGIGPESKMAFGATYAFFPIALNTIGGFSHVDTKLIVVARSLGATNRQMFWRVLLPAALPVIVTGIRIGFIIGFLSIIGAETISGFQGLGTQIVRMAEGMNTATMFAYILVIIVIAVALNAGLSRLQRRFQPGGQGTPS